MSNVDTHRLKICFVGSYGHYHTVIEAMHKSPMLYEVLGVCPSSPEEDMEPLKKELSGLGYHFNHLAKSPASKGRVGGGLNLLTEYENYEKMIQLEKPDIVVVCGQFHLNSEISYYALQKDIHVFCEKPLSITWEGLNKIGESIKVSKAKISSMLTARYEPWFYAAFQAVRRGDVGTVRLLQVQKSYKLGVRPSFYNQRSLYGGTMLWVGIHAIDLIQWLSGEMYQSVSALHSAKDNFDHGELEMIATAQYAMSNDVIASVCCDYYRPNAASTHGDDRVRIVGTKGIIEVSNEKVFRLDEEGSIELPQEEKLNIFEDFLQYVRGSVPARLTMAESLSSTKAALMALDSADFDSIVKG